MASVLRFRFLLILAGLLGAGGVVLAQIEGSERGIAPVDSSSNYEVAGVRVDVAGRTADEARLGGWRQAQRLAWAELWARANGRPPAEAPRLPDGALDAMVAGIVVEEEMIGPRRYLARLGVLFDRARTGRLLGARGEGRRSAPMLVVPVMWSAATATSFETRNGWQRAWAKFRSGGSPIDYVRPIGTGGDPLLLNIAQARRPGRGWWRLLLDQFGAADIVVPEVALTRSWPGGPVTGRFIARHGPDARLIGEFTLRVDDADALPQMLDEGVRRIDALYGAALREGRLETDLSLIIEEEAPPEDVAAIEGGPEETPALALVADYVVQVETPDAAALGAAEASLRGVPGVRQAAATSLALGGVSLLRVQFEGDVAALRVALAARGWQVEDVGGAIRIRRAAPVPAVPPAAAPAP